MRKLCKPSATSAIATSLLLALTACASPEPASAPVNPLVVDCPTPPPPEAWIMVPRAANFPQQLRQALNPSDITPTK